MNYGFKSLDKSILFVALSVFLLMSLSIDYVVTSYDQTNISTTVNITNAGPEILAINVNNGVAFDLNEGTTATIRCNATVRDYNGNSDVNYLNMTLFNNDFSTVGAALDNNTNYFLETPECINVTQTVNTAIYSCAFNLKYFAYNGTWECNATVTDAYGFDANAVNTTEVNPLYAINVTSLLDFGNLAVGDTSTSSETVNITNFGNMDINLSLFGYGGNDFVTGNTLAFVCPSGNISVENQRYNLTDQLWANMIPLTNESTLIPGLTIANQDTETPVVNATYWRLYVPPNPFGQCNGTLVLEAELP